MKPSRSTQRVLLPLQALWALILLAGCAVNWVAPYDAVFDQGVSQLHLDTNAFLVRMASTGASYEGNSRFYQEVQGKIGALRARAEFYGTEKNKGTLSLLDSLAANFENLKELHGAGPLTGDAGKHARTLINSNFRSLLQVELAKKRSSGVHKPTN